jgi:hypothetical protein
MKAFLKRVARRSPIYFSLRSRLEKRRQKQELELWERNGCPAPPPHIIKQRTLQHYANRFNLRTLVETGTYFGEMVDAMKNRFDQIYSIELSTFHYELAKQRFRRYPHIELVHGDSGEEIGRIVNRLSSPTLFWLDGHYSAGGTARGKKDTPIFEELEHILCRPDTRDVIIIDDARHFGTDPAYPSVEELCRFVRSKTNNMAIEIESDAIRIAPALE